MVNKIYKKTRESLYYRFQQFWSSAVFGCLYTSISYLEISIQDGNDKTYCQHMLLHYLETVDYVAVACLTADKLQLNSLFVCQKLNQSVPT